MTFWVYILRCANGQFYVGSTDNLQLRIKEHETGQDGALFSKAHRPVKCVYSEEYDSRESAYAREKQLKGWSRAKKEALINANIEQLKKLSTNHGKS